ncbi:hypothetical protein KM043_007406 [Ampulex compressa]|nr:hypothetical protein KM043_007406 [Ampulex compressa]
MGGQVVSPYAIRKTSESFPNQTERASVLVLATQRGSGRARMKTSGEAWARGGAGGGLDLIFGVLWAEADKNRWEDRFEVAKGGGRGEASKGRESRTKQEAASIWRDDILLEV